MNDKHIKDFILESNIISVDNINKIEDYVFEKNVNFLKALKKTNFLTKENISKISAAILGVPYVNLHEKIISLEDFKKIPEIISNEHNLICFFSTKKSMHVAFSDVVSLEILDSFIDLDTQVKFFFAENKDIVEKKKKYSELISEELFFRNENAVSKISHIENWGMKFQEDLPENFKKDIANDLYTEKFIKGIFEYALQNRADFIFFNISEDKISLSLRIFERNYSFMEIERKVLFSLILSLKKMCDIDIFEKYIMKRGTCIQDIQGKKHAFSISFIQTDFGESLTIQLNREKKYTDDIDSLTIKQKNMLLNARKKDSGFIVFSGQNKEERKKSLYSFLEFDIEKNKEVYLLEERIIEIIDNIKQIEITNIKSLISLLPKIFENFPDVIALEKFSRGIFPMLFQYVSTSKKVFLSHNEEVGKYIESILKHDFDKGQMVKNFSLFIEHKSFKKIKDGKKCFLKSDQIKIIKSFLSDKEISEVFKNEGLEKASKKNISKIEFFTKRTGKTNSVLFSSHKSKGIFEENIALRGIMNTGLFLENSFLKRHEIEKIKNFFRKEIKKSILENALISCYRGQIDIQEVIQYLTR